MTMKLRLYADTQIGNGPPRPWHNGTDRSSIDTSTSDRPSGETKTDELQDGALTHAKCAAVDEQALPLAKVCSPVGSLQPAQGVSVQIGRESPREIEVEQQPLTPSPNASVENPASAQAEIELEMAHIIAADPEYGQSLQRTFDMKENQLRALFDRLTPSQRTALHSSLIEAASGGVLGRLAAERRARLLAYLERASLRERLP